MGVMAMIREQKKKLQQRRVEKLKAAQGDRKAQLKLLKEERKYLEEKRELRREKSEMRNLRTEGVRNAIKGAGKVLGSARDSLSSHQSTSPFSPGKAAPSGSDKTRSILMGSGRNPFYDEPKKKEKKKHVVIKIEQ